MASLSQGRTAAAQCGLFTYKSVPVIFEPPCMLINSNHSYSGDTASVLDDWVGVEHWRNDNGVVLLRN